MHLSIKKNMSFQFNSYSPKRFKSENPHQIKHKLQEFWHALCNLHCICDFKNKYFILFVTFNKQLI